MDRIEMREKLEERLTPKRFEHSLGVEYTATALAMCHQQDLEAAAIAGLLHDCGKNYSGIEKINRCMKYRLPITPYEKQNPELLHAKLGAAIAKDKFKVKDKDILAAITYHTTGRPHMSDLEKIIYIADYIEPNRKPLPDLEEIRQLAFVDLDACMLKILTSTLSYLQLQNKDIDPISRETYNFYANIIR